MTTPKENKQNKIEEERRRKYKENSDKRGRPKERQFHINDLVLCRQQKMNALTPNYDPRPFTIVKIEGTKITATRPDKSIVRNKSFFKHFIPTQSSQTRKPFPTSAPPSRDSSRPQTETENPITFNVEEDDTEETDADTSGSTNYSQMTEYQSSDAEDQHFVDDENVEVIPEQETIADRPRRQIRQPQRFNDYDMEDID